MWTSDRSVPESFLSFARRRERSCMVVLAWKGGMQCTRMLPLASLISWLEQLESCNAMIKLYRYYRICNRNGPGWTDRVGWTHSLLVGTKIFLLRSLSVTSNKTFDSFHVWSKKMRNSTRKKICDRSKNFFAKWRYMRAQLKSMTISTKLCVETEKIKNHLLEEQYDLKRLLPPAHWRYIASLMSIMHCMM